MYTGLSNLGLNSISSVFSPTNLFSNNEQGFLFVNDLSTMYQDSAGTLPAVLEQPVGLWLDNRFGGVRGANQAAANYATVPTFDNVTTVTSPTSFTQTGGTTASRTYLDLVTVPNFWYEVTYNLDAITVGNLTAFARNGAGGVGTILSQTPGLGVGPNRMVFQAISATSSILWVTSGNAGVNVAISAISIRSLPGNHATQPTSANRPTVSARYNELTFTADFQNAVWQKLNGATAPAANTISFSATAGSRVERLVAGAVGSTWTGHFKVSGSPGDQIQIALVDGGGAFPGTIQVVTLTADPREYTVTRTITDAAATGIYWRVQSQAGAAVTFSCSEPDLRRSIHAIPGIPAYQRVNAATDYDSVGFPVRLKTNGTNQWMQTGSIDFSGTDKVTVFAGVTKLSDAAQGVIGELGNGVSASTTKFTLSASPAAGASYRTDLFETGASLSNTRVATTYAAPTGNVLTVGYDYAQATIALQNQIRVNGQIPSSLTATGSVLASSNFGALSMNMGARNGTSLFFNGDIYCLSARGAPTTDSLIAQMEQWANGRMGRVY